MVFNLTNSVTYYEVSEAFGSYKVGDQISIDDYSKLSVLIKISVFQQLFLFLLILIMFFAI